MSTTKATSETSRRSRGLGIVYPMRVLGALLPVVTTILHDRADGTFNVFHGVFIALCLIHPHFFFFLGRKYDQSRGKIDSWALLVDALYLGIASYILGFSPMPTAIMASVALANGLGIRGFRQMLLSAVALVLGMGLPALVAGLNYDPERSLAINIVCAVFIFVYFHLFAWAAYSRASLLKWTRRELREQKRAAEIEKRRSDLLLHNIGPDRMIQTLQREGKLEPEAFAPATLLIVDFSDVSAAADHLEPKEFVDFLQHCFQAFDAICSRFDLERVKTMSDVFLAGRGLPTPSDDDSVACLGAALEIRGFLADLITSRAASGSFCLEARIGVHVGRIVGALIETPKLVYDVWGEAVETLFRVERAGGHGRVTVSEALRSTDPPGFSFEPVGNVFDQDGVAIPIFDVEHDTA